MPSSKSDGIFLPWRPSLRQAMSLTPTCFCLAFFQSAQARCFSALFALTQNFFLARDFLFRKHCLPTILKTAIARRFLAYVSIKEVVVIGELFSGFDIAKGHD